MEYSIFIICIEVFTELTLRFGDTAKIRSSYQEFHVIFQKV